NVKLLIAYDGTAYAGWQRQPLRLGNTVQYQVEKALTTLFGEQISINGAGRTDSGVHALGQVANFYCRKPIPIERMVAAVNHQLPLDIRVLQAEEMPLGFHARYGAVSKRYRYLIEQGAQPTAFVHRYSWQMDPLLDIEAMVQGAAALIGQHDFRHYTVSGVSAVNFVRTISALQIMEPPVSEQEFPWQPLRQPLTIEISANGFLYRMVRMIVCRLVAVGLHQVPPEAIGDFLSGTLKRNIRMAPPQGLMLMEVGYGSGLSQIEGNFP
ncbi:MAG: tRNA pseudouridine(38-40) synthase TruA, partial [Clostridiales bacterium]